MESNVYKCKLLAISPIHIGSGKDYGPSEYVPSKAKLKSGKVVKTIKRVDFANYYMSLEDDKKDRFLQNLSDSKFKLEQYDSNINKKYTKYNSINKASSETTDISEHIKTSDEMYIPGSSIKGAIRSAIFYDLFEYDDIDDVDNLIRDGKYGPFIDRRNYSTFIDSFFSAKYGNSAQKSIMRFIQIGDSTTIKTPTIHEVVSIMAKERGRMPDGTQFYARHGNVVRSFYETIDRGNKVYSDFTISFDDEILYKLGLSDKSNILDIDYIKEAIYNFSKDLIDYELEFADKYDIDYLTKFYKDLAKRNTKEAPLLRIGAGSGFMATTLAMKIKEYDSDVFENIRRTNKRSYEFEYPKSRKITKGGMPLSWVQLSFE